MARISEAQRQALQFIRENPGCCTMAVCRNEYDGPGHLASYARVDRLVKRGLVRKDRGEAGRVALYYVGGL